MTPTLTRENGVVFLMVPIEWRGGTFRERTVTFSEVNLAFVAEAARAFLSYGDGVNGETSGDGDVLTTKLGGTDASPSLLVQNTRGGESVGTVWLTEAQARELLALLD